MSVFLSQFECILLVSRGLPSPQLSFLSFQAFQFRSILELCIGSCRANTLGVVHRFLPSEHIGSRASVLAERTHCVGPLDVWSVLASVFPSLRTWRVCPLRRMEVVHRFLPSERIVLVLWTCGLFWHRSFRACASGAFAL